MALTKIHLKNFVVFAEIEIIPAKGINVFIGKNGTGKTQLLKAVYTDIALSNNPNQGSFSEYFKRGTSSDFLIAYKGTRDMAVHLQEDSEGQACKVKNVSISLSWEKAVDGSFMAGDAYHISYTTFQKPVHAVFMPVKDMLTHAKGLLAMADKYREFPFDKTLTDSIRQANQWTLKEPPRLALRILPKLEELMDGCIEIENEEFFIRKHDGRRVSFAVEAEGLKKIGLLWQLLMNESITEDSILLWDEPEANLNPEYLPVLVECLLELSRHGVQIFVSTHNYLFAKYFDVRKREKDGIAYHSLYADEAGMICCETAETFAALRHNAIMAAYNKLLDEVYGLQAGDDSDAQDFS